MHELSIAQNILEIVSINLPSEEARSVKSVKVRIGRMAGIVSDSLQFCFEAIATGTAFQGATLHIESVPFVLDCAVCGKRFESESGLVVCPSCGNPDTDVVSGTELQVLEIELSDEELTPEASHSEVKPR